MPTTVAEAFVTLRPDLKGFGDEVGRSLNSLGPKFQQAGTMLTAGLSVPIVGLGALASKASIDFESAFAGVAKTVDATDGQLAVLRKGIREMAKELPASAGEIAKVAEAAGQLGIKTESILAFSKVMVDLGETTNLAADEAATSMARIANILQLPQDEFDRLGSTLVDLGNKGASTEREIVEMALRIAGAGRQVGLSADQVLAFGNALSSVGIEAESGGSAISRTFIEIANAVADGGKDLDNFAKVAGVSSAEFAKAFKTDAAGATVTFIEGLKRISEEGQNVFGTLDELGLGEIRVRDALLRASGAGDLFRQSLKDGKQAWAENTALTIEAGKRYETTAAKMEILRNQLNDVAITLGDALVPVLITAVAAAEPLLKVITAMAEGFAKLPVPVQTGIVAVAALVAIIGPMLLLIGGMATGIGALITVLGVMGISFAGGSIAVSGLALAFGTLTLAALPWIALAVAIGVAGYLIYKNWDKISAVLSDVGNAIKDKLLGAFHAVEDFVKNNWRELAPLLAGPFFPIAALATDAFGIRSALEKALKGLVQSAGRLAGDAASAISDAFTGSVGAAGGFISGIADSIEDAFNSAVDAAGEGIAALVSFIEQNFTAENLGRAFAWFLLWPTFILKQAFDAAGPVLTTFFTQTLPAFFTQTVPALGASALALGASIISSLWQGIKDAWAADVKFLTVTIPAAVSSAGTSVIAAAKSLGASIVKGLWQGVKDAWAADVKFLTSTLPDAISGAATSVYDSSLDLGDSIIDGIVEGFNARLHFFERAPGVVKDALVKAFNGYVNQWLDIGKAIVEGIGKGMLDAGPWLLKQATGFFGGFVDGIKAGLGIDSPSKVFAEIGENLMEGMALGINDGSPEAEAAARKASDKITATFRGIKIPPDVLKYLNGGAVPNLAEDDPTNIAATKLLLELDPSAFGDPSKVAGFPRTIAALKKALNEQAVDSGEQITKGLSQGIEKGIVQHINPTLAKLKAAVDVSKTLPPGSIDPIILALPTLDAKLKEFREQGTEPRFVQATKAYLESLKQSFATTTTVVEQIGPRLQSSFLALGPQLQQSGFTAMQGFGTGLTTGITAAVTPAIATASQSGAQVAEGLASGLNDNLQGLSPALAATLDAAMVGAAASIVPAAGVTGANIAEGLATGLQGSEAPVAAANAQSQSIIGAFNGSDGWLTEAGGSVIRGLWNGMREAWKDVSAWLDGLKEKIKDLKGPLDADRVLLMPAGNALMLGLQDGLAQGFERNVTPTLAKMGGVISDSMPRVMTGVDYLPSANLPAYMSAQAPQAQEMAFSAAPVPTDTGIVITNLGPTTNNYYDQKIDIDKTWRDISASIAWAQRSTGVRR